MIAVRPFPTGKNSDLVKAPVSLHRGEFTGARVRSILLPCPLGAALLVPGTFSTRHVQRFAPARVLSSNGRGFGRAVLAHRSCRLAALGAGCLGAMHPASSESSVSSKPGGSSWSPCAETFNLQMVARQIFPVSMLQTNFGATLGARHRPIGG